MPLHATARAVPLEGTDGTRVVNYITPSYVTEISPKLREVPGEFDPAHGKAIWVYGVGDHGGGPTRRDITRALCYQTIPTFPTVKFGTATEFFASLQSDISDYPIYRGELQYIFEGLLHLDFAHQRG